MASSFKHDTPCDVALTQLKGRKLRSYNVKLSDDKKDCHITGMAITNDGRRLLVDYRNNKVKLFSGDMKLLSSLSLSHSPWNIAVLNDQEAVVTTDEKSLVLVNISGRHMSINTNITVSYDVYQISKYGEKLAVTCAIPASVKLIDKTGRVYWSAPSDDHTSFSCTIFVTSDIERNTVTVTDHWNFTLTVVNGDTGDVIKTRSVEDKWPKGVTTGPSGNIYVCYHESREVAELTGDLAEERILLSQQDGLGHHPLAISYDKSCGQLIISYDFDSVDANSVDVFDLSIDRGATGLSAGCGLALTQLKGRKLRSYNVKLSDDREDCHITGIAITNDGRRLLVDYRNNKVKLFSQDMKLLSSLSLSHSPWNIAVLNDQEAVVTTDEKSLVLVNISGRHMSINTNITVSYDVYQISKYGEKLAVTCLIIDDPIPASVKLIDKTGRVYWSAPSDDHTSFSGDMFVTSDIERNTVTVTDHWNFTLTVVNGDTGDVIKIRSEEDKWPKGVTTGPSGNIYVCYHESREVAVLTGDLAEERILLSQQDGLGHHPLAISYDKSCGQLITSYDFDSVDANSVDVFDLSFDRGATGLSAGCGCGIS